MHNKSDQNIHVLFENELNNILNSEKQIINGLPKLIKAADSHDLKEAFQKHLEETKEHVQRLMKIFSLLNIPIREAKCEAMQGLIQECADAIHQYDKSAVRDAALISTAQRIEHYEISAYGTLRTFAKELDFKDVVNLLQETENEEASADKKLTELAEGGLLVSGINHKANQ